MISIVKDSTEMKEKQDERHSCIIQCADGSHDCSYERCSKTGDLRILMEEGGFGDKKTLPSNQLVTIKLGDGSNGEYHGTFDKEGKFTPAR